MNEMGDKKNNNSLSPNKNLIKSETVLKGAYCDNISLYYFDYFRNIFSFGFRMSFYRLSYRDKRNEIVGLFMPIMSSNSCFAINGPVIQHAPKPSL